MCLCFARRSSSRHIASENRIERGDDPAALVPLRGRPRLSLKSARAFARPSAPRPSTTAREKSISGISRNDARLGSCADPLVFAFFIAPPLLSRCPARTDDAHAVVLDLAAHDQKDAS